jgi:hypothetical protein
VALGLEHLVIQTVRVLGSEPGDDAVCAQLYSALSPEARALLDSPDPMYEVAYFRVGDRHLALWDGMPPHHQPLSA